MTQLYSKLIFHKASNCVRALGTHFYICLSKKKRELMKITYISNYFFKKTFIAFIFVSLLSFFVKVFVFFFTKLHALSVSSIYYNVTCYWLKTVLSEANFGKMETLLSGILNSSLNLSILALVSSNSFHRYLSWWNITYSKI